tara:strand:- start:2623 stop:3330 length:708 start_codon:yes stop_codon:yes gene_type:complete
MKEKVVVLDFDGVLCNGIDECLIVSYNSYYGVNIDSKSSLSEDFINFFYKHRSFVRPPSEFYILYKAFEKDKINLSMESFNCMKKELSTEIKSFEKCFFQNRDILRQNPELWFSFHTIYEEATNFLESYKDRFFILTTKDENSVKLLSNKFGFSEKIRDIFSKEISSNKAILFDTFFSKYGAEFRDKRVIFIDDNEWNLADVINFPIDLYFAPWGYSGRQMVNSFETINELGEIL